MHIDGITGTLPGVAQVLDHVAIDARHRAHVAQVDRLAVVARQLDPLAEQHVGGAEVQRFMARPPSFFDLAGQIAR